MWLLAGGCRDALETRHGDLTPLAVRAGSFCSAASVRGRFRFDALKTHLPSIMPVRRDVHRTRGTAHLAHEAPANARPRALIAMPNRLIEFFAATFRFQIVPLGNDLRLILGQGV